uniref:Cationic amino acid transporter 5 n=1 Tax=Anthurium amnicola TaxID=1678845 RepID=A0A1D1Y5E5_9ARAE
MAPGGGAADGAGSGSDSSRYWRWSKADFFPEPSFSSWSSYASALSQTFPRLRSRLLRRSSSSAELRLLPLRSHHALRRCLSWWDLAWLGFGAVVGSGVFVLTGLEARENSGPAVVLSYAAAGFTALLSVFCYTEFAVEIPVAGGSFAYLRVELGDLVSYLAAANILLEAVVGAAGIARSWTSYFAALLDRPPDSLRIPAPALADGFNLLDPIAVVALVTCSAIAASGTRLTSALNWVTSLVGVAVIAFIIGAGSTRADSSNLSPFFPFGARGVFRAAGVVYWSYTGFDMVATMAEETRNPARDIPIGLLGSMVSITVVYCAMALVLCSMQSYAVLDPDAAYSVAFAAVGMRWAKYLVALGALKGMTTGMLVGALGQGRYTTQIARAHMIPPYFALVHPRTGTTVHATILVTGASACIALFSSLDVLATVSSISTLFVFMLVAVALLVRRYYVRGVTPASGLAKLWAALALIIGSSVAVSACWGSSYSGWLGYAVAVPVWFLATLGLAVCVPQQRAPRVWGAPLVPWLPSLSIATNLFLMGSLGYQAFVRFGICMVALMAYYLLVGLHATYDVDQELQSRPGEESAVGKDGPGSGVEELG